MYIWTCMYACRLCMYVYLSLFYTNVRLAEGCILLYRNTCMNPEYYGKSDCTVDSHTHQCLCRDVYPWDWRGNLPCRNTRNRWVCRCTCAHTVRRTKHIHLYLQVNKYSYQNYYTTEHSWTSLIIISFISQFNIYNEWFVSVLTASVFIRIVATIIFTVAQ